MGDTFNMPFKLQIILASLKSAADLFDGIDSGSVDHKVVAEHFKRLSDLLMSELEKVPAE